MQDVKEAISITLFLSPSIIPTQLNYFCIVNVHLQAKKAATAGLCITFSKSYFKELRHLAVTSLNQLPAPRMLTVGY